MGRGWLILRKTSVVFDVKEYSKHNDIRAYNFAFEVCKGCTEKSEFIKKIEELKPKYVKEEL